MQPTMQCFQTVASSTSHGVTGALTSPKTCASDGHHGNVVWWLKNANLQLDQSWDIGLTGVVRFHISTPLAFASQLPEHCIDLTDRLEVGTSQAFIELKILL
jgi:hypothetical protein